MTAELKFTRPVQVGANSGGWSFWVGRLAGEERERWLGFAIGKASPRKPGTLFIFSEVSDGVELGVDDCNLAIRLTGAVAQDAEQGYGGIETWHVGPELQVDPDELRCRLCGDLHAGECELI